MKAHKAHKAHRVQSHDVSWSLRMDAVIALAVLVVTITLVLLLSLLLPETPVR